MTGPIKPKTPDPEPIIELVEHIPLGYAVLIFAAGAILVFGIVVIMGNKWTTEQVSDDGAQDR
jgi:hypothetical protein